jgi:Ran GTPase-activating protein (RanGAP) involved in mRNA processing and transport
VNNDDVAMIYHTLRVNSFITVLDLRYNRISDEGAESISKLLVENSCIIVLNLMCNDIGPEGGQSIAESLQVIKKQKNIL